MHEIIAIECFAPGADAVLSGFSRHFTLNEYSMHNIKPQEGHLLS